MINKLRTFYEGVKSSISLTRILQARLRDQKIEIEYLTAVNNLQEDEIARLSGRDQRR